MTPRLNFFGFLALVLFAFLGLSPARADGLGMHCGTAIYRTTVTPENAIWFKSGADTLNLNGTAIIYKIPGEEFTGTIIRAGKNYKVYIVPDALSKFREEGGTYKLVPSIDNTALIYITDVKDPEIRMRDSEVIYKGDKSKKASFRTYFIRKGEKLYRRIERFDNFLIEYDGVREKDLETFDAIIDNLRVVPTAKLLKKRPRPDNPTFGTFGGFPDNSNIRFLAE